MLRVEMGLSERRKLKPVHISGDWQTLSSTFKRSQSTERTHDPRQAHTPQEAALSETPQEEALTSVLQPKPSRRLNQITSTQLFKE